MEARQGFAWRGHHDPASGHPAAAGHHREPALVRAAVGPLGFRVGDARSDQECHGGGDQTGHDQRWTAAGLGDKHGGEEQAVVAGAGEGCDAHQGEQSRLAGMKHDIAGCSERRADGRGRHEQSAYAAHPEGDDRRQEFGREEEEAGPEYVVAVEQGVRDRQASLEGGWRMDHPVGQEGDGAQQQAGHEILGDARGRPAVVAALRPAQQAQEQVRGQSAEDSQREAEEQVADVDVVDEVDREVRRGGAEETEGRIAGRRGHQSGDQRVMGQSLPCRRWRRSPWSPWRRPVSGSRPCSRSAGRGDGRREQPHRPWRRTSPGTDS